MTVVVVSGCVYFSERNNHSEQCSKQLSFIGIARTSELSKGIVINGCVQSITTPIVDRMFLAP